jgi:curved DNA-binding protein CbpA
MLPDYYSILKISPNATPEKIRAAYRRLAKQRHPDAGGTSDDFRALQEAYDILSDPARRRDYDAQRRPRTRRRTPPASPRRSRTGDFVEPLIPPQPPEPLRARRPERPSDFTSLHTRSSLDDFDRLFREFDEFFDQLEKQFLESYWGRSE